MPTPRKTTKTAARGRRGFRDRICNVVPSQGTETDFGVASSIAAGVVPRAGALPASVDLRAPWWKINDQELTGSCVGWATADGVVRWHMVRAGKLAENRMLSPRHVWMASKETDSLEPRSPYSASKAGSDLIALSYHHTYGLPVTVTRCTNNFGPYQYPEKAIPLFTTNLIEGKRIPLYGDGLNQRDWLYVDDHCAGVLLVLREGAVGEIYNIGAGNETPNRVLVDKLLTLLGVGEEMVEYVEDRLGHDRRYSVDIEKMTALGWSKQRTLDEALAATVDWYRANEWWWRPLKNG